MIENNRSLHWLILAATAPILILMGCGSPAAQEKPRPIIDMHVHAPKVLEGGSFEWYEPVPHNPITHEPTVLTSTGDLDESILNEMNRQNFVKVVVSDTPENVARWKTLAGDKVIQGIAIAPTPAFWPSIEELRALHKDGRLEVLGEMMPQYYGMSLTDPKLAPYYALAEELDIPIGIHTGLASDPSEVISAGVREVYRGDFGNPTGFEEVLNRHPKLRVYLMHAGHPYFADTYALLASYPNVYVELAYIPYFLPAKEFHRYLETLVNSIDGMDKRILFGTDTYLWPETITASIEEIENADYLTNEQKNNIFCGNAARFLKLDENICAQ